MLVRSIAALTTCGLLACSAQDGPGKKPPGGTDVAPDVDGPFPGACASPPRTDPFLPQRRACAFKAGDHASTTLGLTSEERAEIPIKHIVVVMKENRSFDHVFGGLKSLQPEADVADAHFTNRDGQDASVPFFHLRSTCVGFDPGHQWAAMHDAVGDGGMQGFVRSAAGSCGGDGHFVMGHYEQADLPFDYFLASTFALADRYFPSVRSGTFPNRDYLLLGTSDGVTATGYSIWPDPALPTIFDELTRAGVSWGVYADDHPLQRTLDNPAKTWSALNPWSPVSKLIDDFANDTVPNVVFVDGLQNVEDEHPTADLQVGEAWTKRLYDAALASRAWGSTAILLTYDEGGGFADHVRPSDQACLARPGDAAFFELGVRVPFVAISPWARRHFVSHVQKEHTSITRFIEAVFDLPALTARDANSDALLDMFDFACPPGPIPPAPAAGTKGCGGSATITLDRDTFASGEPIKVHFAGGPGDPKDWIAVYAGPVTPASVPALWTYVATGSQTASAATLTHGTVKLDAASAGSPGAWPLAPGTSWTAYFMVNGGHKVIASVGFDVHN